MDDDSAYTTFLERYRVGTLKDLYYIPKFISEVEEAALISNSCSCKGAWQEVKDRKVLNLGGVINQGILLQAPLPSYENGNGIHSHQDGPIYQPVVCILSAGSSSVMHFRRRLPQGGFEPHPITSVMLQPCSLLIFSNEAYTECSHGIDSIPADVMHGGIHNLDLTGLRLGDILPRCNRRLSFTARHVLKIRKNLVRL